MVRQYGRRQLLDVRIPTRLLLFSVLSIFFSPFSDGFHLGFV
jgi:hypothetical protein